MQDYFKLAQEQIALGKPVNKIKDSISKALKAKHKQDWEASLRAEYDLLFPTYTEEVFSLTFDDIHFEIDDWKLERNNVLIISENYETNTIKYKTLIEYESYVSYKEWLEETVITVEAVAEVKVGDVAITPAVEEVREYMRPYTPLTDEELMPLVDAEYRKYAVPTYITMRQARIALLNKSLLTTITNAINTGTDEAMKIEWEYATEIRRDWASLITLTTALGLTKEQVDDLFIYAKGL